MGRVKKFRAMSTMVSSIEAHAHLLFTQINQDTNEQTRELALGFYVNSYWKLLHDVYNGRFPKDDALVNARCIELAEQALETANITLNL